MIRLPKSHVRLSLTALLVWFVCQGAGLPVIALADSSASPVLEPWEPSPLQTQVPAPESSQLDPSGPLDPAVRLSEYVAAEPTCLDTWIISTRHLPTPRCRKGISHELAYYRFVGGRMLRSSASEFQASTVPNQSLCVFVHGNRMAPEDVPEQARLIRRRLNCAGHPCRLVFWSWPSDRVRGPMRDARIKGARADGEAFYLGSFLAQLPPNISVSTIGYSFGARAISGSLHLLAGGSFRGNQLLLNEQAVVRPLVVLFAAAIPSEWLRPGGSHGLAIQQAERVISFYNPRDPVLAHYDFVFKTGGTEALGYQGISSRSLGIFARHVTQYNVGGAVGRSHALLDYLDNVSIMATVRRYTFQD